MSSKILILDGDNLSHRAYHAMGNLKWKGKSVAAIWGFLNILGGVCGKYKPKKIYVCWDGYRHKERLKLHPDYKKREPKFNFDSDDFKRQKHEIRILINALGIPQIHREGREADDYIYAIQKRIIKNTEKTKVIMCSGDKDFRPHVTKRVWLYDERKGLITPLNFQKLFDGLKPSQYVDYLALMGDKSDNIPGVPGYGEKTALKFLNEYGSINNFLTTEITHPHFEKVYAATGLSRALIDLKWFNENKIKDAKITEDDYWRGDIKPKRKIKKYKERALEKFGIKKFITDQFINQIPCAK